MSSIIGRALSGLSTFGDALWAWVASMNAWVAALFVLAFALDRLLASRVSAAWRVLLYVPILVRLLVPEAWVISVPVAAAAAPFVAPPDVVATIAPATAALGATVDEPRLSLSWTIALPLAYVVGAALLALRWLRELRRLREVLRVSSEAPAWIRGLGRQFDIVEHPTAGPLLIGTCWPRLVLPRGLRERVGEGGVRAVVAHEASHVRRRDPLFAAALHALVILFWPIVAVWCGASRVRTLLEIACDEHALRNADAAGRRSYGEALIELASTRSRSVVALGFGDSLRERIVSLAAGERRWPAVGQALVAMFACAVIAACGSGRVERQVPDTQGTAPVSHRIDMAFLRTPLVLQDARIASIRTIEADRLLLSHESAILYRPTLEAMSGEVARLAFDAKADDGATRTIQIEANVVADVGGVRTIQLRCTEDGKPTTTLEAGSVTLKLASDSTVELRLDGNEARSLMLTVRPATDSGGVPILKDLPLVNVAVQDESKQHDPLNGDYPQVMCMMNLIEADGPLYFAKDNVIEQGRNDGAGHRVQAGELTERTFDWFRRMKGYRNIAAPAVLVRLGSEASVSIGSTDKSGASVADNSVTVRFSERDGQLQATVHWSVKAEDGLQLDGHTVSGVNIASDGALLVILPELKSTPKHGRILMLRPTLIRSVNEYPFQRD